MVRRAHHASAPLRRRVGAAEAQHRRRFERVFLRQRRQQAGEALRQHRLAGARRTQHQHAVAACGGDFEGAFRARLTFDVTHVGQVGCGSEGLGHGLGQRFGRWRVAGPGGRHQVEQVVRFEDRLPPRQRRLAGTRTGQHQRARAAVTAALQRQGHRQCAPYRPQVAAQRQLACVLVAVDAPRIELTAGHQDAERDRQVEAARLLRQVGRREVDRDAFRMGEVEAAVEDGRAHALAGLLDFGVGEADQRVAGQAVGQVDLDRHCRGVQGVQRAAVYDGEGHAGVRQVGSASGGRLSKAIRRPGLRAPRY